MPHTPAPAAHAVAAVSCAAGAPTTTAATSTTSATPCDSASTASTEWRRLCKPPRKSENPHDSEEASARTAASTRSVRGGAAPLLRGDVPQRLGEDPAMPGGILRRVLPLAVLEVRRLHQDHRAVGAGALAVGDRVVDAHDHRVRLLARARRATVVAHVADDQ